MLPWQVIADCEHCHTTGGVLQLMDPLHPACHLGVPTSSECRMCGHGHTAALPDFAVRDPLSSGRCPSCRKPLTPASREASRCELCEWAPEIEENPGIDCTDPDAVRAGLTRWAESEGLTPEELCTANLGGTIDEILQRYATGEAVESTADSIAFLFPGMAAGGSGEASLGVAAPALVARDRPTPSPADPRAPARLLISVMVADGQIRAGERAFVEAFLIREGLEPLEAWELRPWRPHEVGRIADRDLVERAIRAAVELMHLDGERDGSEIRIVRTFARAWGVGEAQVEEWNRTYGVRYAPPLSVVWRALSRWVRTR